jgi:CelD/BcsL family acetyltransferase involved in cellulose biosynthesis
LASTQFANSTAFDLVGAGQPAHRGTTTPDELWSAWDAAAERSGSPIEQAIWGRACAESICAGNQLTFVTARSGGEITGIAPLTRKRGSSAPFELIGVETLYEPMDLIYRDAEALHALVREMLRLDAPIFLRRVPAGAASLEALRDALGSQRFAIGREVAGTPAIDLNEGWQDPESQFNAGRRSDMRRMRRNAEKLGPLTFEVLRPSAREVDALVDEALRIEAASWKGETGSALALDEMRGRFFRLWTQSAAQTGVLRICFLKIGETRVAMQIAAECGGRFWLLKIGYDQQFSRCSPGSLLMLHTLRYAATAGLRSYEFLGSPAPWTEVWAPMVRPCASIRAYPLRASGVAALTTDVARGLLPQLGRLFRAKGEG